jgi:hypothetical protein
MGESILGGLLDLRDRLPGAGDALRLDVISISTHSDKTQDLRSPTFTLFSKTLDGPEHFFPPRTGIHSSTAQTHTDFLIRVHLQEPLQQEMPHVQADKHATVGRVLLLWAVMELDEPDRSTQKP